MLSCMLSSFFNKSNLFFRILLVRPFDIWSCCSWFGVSYSNWFSPECGVSSTSLTFFSSTFSSLISSFFSSLISASSGLGWSWFWSSCSFYSYSLFSLTYLAWFGSWQGSSFGLGFPFSSMCRQGGFRVQIAHLPSFWAMCKTFFDP